MWSIEYDDYTLLVERWTFYVMWCNYKLEVW
jgi:hypothetical protein